MPKEKILIVDDEPSILHLTMNVLAQEGYAVKGTSSGRAGLGMVEGEKFDLLLIDIVMPGMDGLELLRRAWEVDPDITAVIMTGYGTVDTTIESLKAGAQSFLQKPFTVQELRAAIKEALERSYLVKENVRLKALLPLFEVSKALISEIKLDKLLGLIVQTAALETGADMVSLMLPDEETQELTIKAAIGLPREVVTNARVKIGEGIAGRVVETGKPLILDKEARVSQYLRETVKETEDISALCVPLTVKDNVIGVLNCSKMTTESLFTQSDLELVSILAGQAATAIENARLFQSVEAQQIRLEQLLTQLVNAQESERNKLSAEIHDSIAQLMISASYHAQSCAALLSESRLDEARDETEHITSTIGQSIKELRRIIADLYPPTLGELGLEQALRQNVEALQKETGIACHFQAVGQLDGLSPSLEIAIYRIVQEAFNNARRHAGATELNVRLQFCSNDVSAEIQDNGKGFDLSQAMETKKALGGHMGLATMKDRAEVLGGNLRIETEREAGTRVILTIPLSPHRSSPQLEES